MILRALLCGIMMGFAALAAAAELRLDGSETEVPLAPGEERVVYLRIADRDSLMIESPSQSREPRAFRDAESQVRLIDGFILGGLLVMSLFGLLMLFMFRDRAFLFNALATLTYFLGEGSAKGYAAIYLWPDAGAWTTRCLPLFALLGVGLNILFLRDLLLTRRRFPQIDRVLLVLLAIQWLPAPGILFSGSRAWVELSYLVNFPATAILVLVGIFAMRNGVHAARYYTVAYAILALGSILHALAMWGGTTHPELDNYALPVAMLLSNALMLVSVVDRIMLVRKEKEAAQNALLAARAAHEAELEQAVAARTADLHAALDETRKASQSQSRLLAYISHDLRAPLATIVNYVRLLVRGGAGDVRRYQETIERSALHQLELIDDLVEYARGELDHIELAPVATYLHDWLDNLAAQAELLAAQHGNRFQLRVDADCAPVVVFDPKRLRQVLLNLLSNAAKFTERGEIHCELRATGVADGQLDLAFAVTDTGSGIAPGDIERVFEPFERRQTSREGSGLGLSIARQLVRSMGGELSAVSELGRGSCFRFRLRVAIADEAEVMLAPPPFAFPAPFGAAKTLLVADDNPASREYLRETLVAADFDVVCAEDGAAALRLALERNFDALLLDQFMPGMGAWDILRKLHDAHPGQVPAAILCSALPPQRPDDHPQGIRFHRVLLKPVAGDKLLRILMELFSCRTDGGATALEVRPSAEWMAALRRMVDAGHISDIEDWASTLAGKHPELADFARRVGAAAVRIDIAELTAILDA